MQRLLLKLDVTRPAPTPRLILVHKSSSKKEIAFFFFFLKQLLFCGKKEHFANFRKMALVMDRKSCGEGKLCLEFFKIVGFFFFVFTKEKTSPPKKHH